MIHTQGEILRSKVERVPANEDCSADFALLFEEIAKSHIPAAGLAGNQVGLNKAICVMRLDDRFVPCINPRVAKLGHDRLVEEGCLSLSEKHQVSRSTKVILSWMTPNWKPMVRTLTGFNAQVAQHEVDHLNGVMIDGH